MDHMLKCFICALVSAVLFFLLSPGVLLTLPPCKNGSIFMTLNKDKNNDKCVTSYEAAAVHALVFGVVMFLICLATKDGSSAMSSSFFK